MSRAPDTDFSLASGSSADSQRPQEAITGFPRPYLYAVVACALVALSLAAFFLHREYRKQLRYWQDKLSHIADVNQQLLQNWMKERNEDAELVASFPCSRMAALKPARRQRALPRGCEQRLGVELVSVVSAYGYAGAYILDHAGRLEAASDNAPPLPPEAVKATAEARKIATILPQAGHATYPQLAFITPIRAAPADKNHAAAPVVGFVVLLARPEDVASLLLSDAGATASGEAVLVTLAEGKAVFISPLRHGRNARPMPALQPATPARLSLLEKRATFGQYRDYRGVAVLAATRFLPEAGWGMVTKVDRAEALSDFRHTLFLGVAITVLSILLLVSMVEALWSYLRIQPFRTALLDSAIGLAVTNTRYFIGVNRAFCRITGYSEKELRALDWLSLTHPDDRGRNFALGQRMLAGELPSFLLEKRYIRKDGETVWVRNSTSPVRNKAGKICNVIALVEDITERKRAEQQLQESERKYRRLFETSDAFVQVDMNGNLLEFNPAYHNMLGYPAEELAGLTYRDITPHKWRDLEKKVIEEQVLTHGYSGVYEKEYRKKDGTVFPVELRTFLIRTDAGEPAGMWAMVRDISERKRAEKEREQLFEQLEHEHEKLRAVLESVADEVWAFDAQGKLLFMNPSAVAGLGVLSTQVGSIDELLRHLEVLKPDGTPRPPEECPIYPCLKGATVTGEEIIRHTRTGELRYRHYQTTPMRNRAGKVVGVVAVASDITEQHRTAQALLDSEARLRAFIANAPYGIFRYAHDRFLSANPALARLLEYDSEAQVLAMKVSVDVFHDTAECRDLSALAKQQPHFQAMDLKWKRKNGTVVVVHLNGRTARDPESGEELIEAMVEDVTQQRIVEEHLRQTDKMDALGRLAGGVAHDFNNLLLGITLNLEHALKVKPANHLLQHDLEQALSAAGSASLLTRQLLLFGRKQKPQQQLITLNEVVLRNRDFLERVSGENIVLDCSLDDALGKVIADPVQIQQVILNLVLNARDAMPQGGKVSIRTANIDLTEVPAEEYFIVPPRPGPYVVLDVSDTGSGIAQAALPHIFEPFFTTKTQGSGTGLGLATSYGIVHQSAGHFSVHSEPGHGTSFKVYLPRLHGALVQQAPVVSVTTATNPAFRAHGRTVLLVDDTEVVRKALAKELEIRGFAVLSAPGPAEALLTSQQHRGAIDLLLTDIVMPGIGGRELALRLLQRRPRLKVLYISGYDKDTIAARGLIDDSEILLHKPFSSQQLLDAVRTVLREEGAWSGGT